MRAHVAWALRSGFNDLRVAFAEGFIGLGNMGQWLSDTSGARFTGSMTSGGPMARNLLKAGHEACGESAASC